MKVFDGATIRVRLATAMFTYLDSSPCSLPELVDFCAESTGQGEDAIRSEVVDLLVNWMRLGKVEETSEGWVLI